MGFTVFEEVKEFWWDIQHVIKVTYKIRPMRGERMEVGETDMITIDDNQRG